MANYPKPSWRPENINVSSWTQEAMSRYTNHKRAFVVYENGTTVFSNIVDDSVSVVCGSFLIDVVTHSPDFSVMPMADGNFIVTFRGPVRGVVDGRFVESNQKWLLQEALASGLLPSERLIAPNPDVVKANHHAIGLYARAKLYLDVESKKIVARFVPGRSK